MSSSYRAQLSACAFHTHRNRKGFRSGALTAWRAQREDADYVHAAVAFEQTMTVATPTELFSIASAAICAHWPTVGLGRNF